MLKVKNLVKIYKVGKSKESVVALNNVSIDFPETGLVFLLGKSGSGKSTLLNAIGGLDTFNSGEIIIKGRSSKDFSQADFDSYRNTFIGFIFQEYNVLEEFSVAKNLSIALELQGKKSDKEAVNKLLSQVDMLEFAKRKPNQLSGGQKQRVAIARALIKNPEIIMADEPTGALDSNTGKQVMDTLKKLSETKLVIIVSHDREFAEIYGDRIIELKDGHIIQDVTKKEVESRKTDSGVSIIDDKIIHIKKGIQLTDDDLTKITSVLKTQTAHSDVIISIDENANEQVKKANFITEDGNKEAFLQTTPEDIVQKNYNAKEFKLIKSQLKFKDSFKMGASALKNKVGKLIFTVFLSFIAFTMFGVIDTVSTFNRASAIFHTVEEFNKTTVSLLKEEKGKWSNSTSPFTESDINIITQKFPDIKIKKIVGANIRFGGSYWGGDYYSKTLQIQDLEYQSSNPAKQPYYSGMTHVTLEEMKSLGLNLVAGRLPEAENEIAISKHIYDAFDALNSSANLTYDKMLTTYKEFYMNNHIYNGTIVGIIDDGSDYSEYMNMDTAAISADYMLQQKISRELDFGFANMLYITEDKYNELLDEPISMNLNLIDPGNENSTTSFELSNLRTLQDEYNEYIDGWAEEYINSREYVLKNGQMYQNHAFAQLSNNEILIHVSAFDDLYGTNDSNNRATKLNSETQLTLDFCSFNPGTYEYDNVVKSYNVVGYFSSYESTAIVCNATTKEEINTITSNEPLAMRSGSMVRSAYNSYSPETIENRFFNSNSSLYTKEEYANQYIQYYKGGSIIDSNGNFKELGENEVILREYMISSLGQGEELHDKIESGINIKVCKDYEGKSVVLTLKVVGITTDYANSMYISQSTINNSLKDVLTGFDYAIAVLSDNSRTNEKFVDFCETFNQEGIKYTIQTGATPILDQFGSTLEDVAQVLLYVGIGFAVFASLLLMNFISTSISYKKREIGILRALGARGSDVFGIFFNESSVIAMINFVLSITATIITSMILNNIIITKLGLDLVLLSVGIRQVLLLFGISIGTAFISSFLPVMKIARKKPIDAINNR